MNAEDQKIWGAFVDLGGRSAQRLGLARSLGQVYAALYLSPDPLGLEDLMRQLHISKGNASMSVRQLAEWGAVERSWVKGDRRDYWRARDDFRAVLKHFTSAVLKPRLASTSDQLKGMKESLASPRNRQKTDEGEFMRQRIAKLHSFESKMHKLLPLAEKLL